MDWIRRDAAAYEALEKLESEGRERLRGWRSPLMSHLASAITGAIVALVVVGASVGFEPRERVVTRTQVVRVPAPITPPQVPPVSPPAGTAGQPPAGGSEAAAGAQPGQPGQPEGASSDTGRPLPSSPESRVPEGPPARRVPLPPLVMQTPRLGPGELPPFQPPISRKVVLVPKDGPKDQGAKEAAPKGSALAQGTSLAEQGKLDEAIAKLREAAKANPRDPQTHTALYKVYRQKMIAAERYEDEERYRALANEAQDRAQQLLRPTAPAVTPPTGSPSAQPSSQPKSVPAAPPSAKPAQPQPSARTAPPDPAPPKEPAPAESDG